MSEPIRIDPPTDPLRALLLHEATRLHIDPDPPGIRALRARSLVTWADAEPVSLLGVDNLLATRKLSGRHGRRSTARERAQAARRTRQLDHRKARLEALREERARMIGDGVPESDGRRQYVERRLAIWIGTAAPSPWA